jgi:hypothetical protein
VGDLVLVFDEVKRGVDEFSFSFRCIIDLLCILDA